ncbi:sensor histidine kinase [Allorhizocola rhizosphaerae]|uniref:sensor histidine kinase n=1 Tax=Allorhizocola rhizosphaerae TaxID=1872709 RepID=UPI000E3DA027|nr:histidine kinase [Allorhizocola rhizosphaerae]
MINRKGRVVWGWIRVGCGLALGALTALAGLALLVLAVPVLLAGLVSPSAARLAGRGAKGLAELERLRLAYFMRSDNSRDYTGDRALGYVAARIPLGLLGGIVLMLGVYGAGAGVMVITHWGTGREVDGIPPSPFNIVYVAVAGVVLLFLEITGIAGVAALDRALARRFLGPSPRERFERRIAELSAARAEVVQAVNDERRRIERDLHDGVQQRVVALGMLLGRATRAWRALEEATRPGSEPRREAGRGETPATVTHRGRERDAVAELLRQAHEEAQHVLNDLRDVSWRIYPAALDDGGLPAALENVAERATLPLKLHYGLSQRLPGPMETAVYFVVSEAVTNAIKHARASTIGVEVDRQGAGILVRVSDDGVGGADSSGSGLSGLARRLAALDGQLHVDSPAGGPTTITAVLPCA